MSEELNEKVLMCNLLSSLSETLAFIIQNKKKDFIRTVVKDSVMCTRPQSYGFKCVTAYYINFCYTYCTLIMYVIYHTMYVAALF